MSSAKTDVATAAETTTYLTPGQMREGAKSDREEKDVTDVFGGTVRIKSLTAAGSAMIKQASIVIGGGGSGGGTKFNWSASAMLQFRLGVIEPQLTEADVQDLFITSGPSFEKVVQAIDEISGTKTMDLKKAEEDFRQPGDN